MIYMGDEYGYMKGGNNNIYCYDNYVIFLMFCVLGDFKLFFYVFNVN